MGRMKLTGCQKKGLKVLQGEGNVFLTGFAGTGKSYLISHFLREIVHRRKIPVLASTGAAAVLVGGRTFHSFFGLGRMSGSPLDILRKAYKDGRVRSRIRKAEAVIVDEVSMLSGETLAVAEALAREVRENTSPWGGLRIIAVGDFAQLPPVSEDRKNAWAFLHPVWALSELRPVVLETPVRVRDGRFGFILNKVRQGIVDHDVSEFLNDRCETVSPSEATRLFPRRSPTERYNLDRLEELPGKVRTFATRYTGKEMYLERIRKDAPIPEVLSLKLGALVMIRVNDPQLRYVNGTVGVVTGMDEEALAIDVEGEEFYLEKHEFALLDGSGREVATARNFPISLAWASTIHKAQGATLDHALVDLEGLWEPGQAYVALSRVRDAQRLHVSRWTPRSIRADQVVSDFYDQGCPFTYGQQARIELDDADFEQRSED